ncbi:hypothetical protein Tco_0042380, partial [Tanacetum coccineum]
SEEAKKESTKSNSDDEARVTRSVVTSFKVNKLKKFDFVTKYRRHIYLSEEQINNQNKLEEEAKAEASKKKGRYYDKMLNRRTESRITNCDVLTRKGPITFKVYREDDTYEVIPNFKVNDLHLGEWREVMKECPDRKGKGWQTIYDQIQTRMDYLHTTEAEPGINLDIPLIQYGDHLPGTMLNEPVLGMIMFNSYHRRDFVTIEDLKDFSNAMLYTVQEIFFRRHQDPGVDDHARTFSSLLLAEVDKRNLNPLKQMRTIEQLRQ